MDTIDRRDAVAPATNVRYLVRQKVELIAPSPPETR